MMDQGNPSSGYVTNSRAINTMVQVRRERGKEPSSGVGLRCVCPPPTWPGNNREAGLLVL